MRGALIMTLLTLAGPGGQAEEKDLALFFRERCAVCHGLNGSGRGPGGTRLGGRPLLDSRRRLVAVDPAWAKLVLEGRGAMPSFRTLLTEAEAQRLVTKVLPSLGERKKF